MLDKIQDSVIDGCDDDVSDDDDWEEDEPWDGPRPGDGWINRTVPARIRCLPEYESDSGDLLPFCFPCEEDDESIGAKIRAYFLLTTDDGDTVRLCYPCAEIAHALIESQSALQEHDRFDPPFVSYFVLCNGIPRPGAAVWRMSYSECEKEYL